MTRIVVTGADGFVGRALCPLLEAAGHAVRRATRGGVLAVGDIGPETDWCAALGGCEAVVHLAARVHVLSDTSSDPLVAFRAVNAEGTLNLARQAAAVGVKRFVFVSSIKVNGEGRDTPYTEADAVAPADAYALSKWEAEQGLREIALATGMQVVILRPPLVYGPGVKANFWRLMRAVAGGWPLPFGRVENRRSLLYLGNLVDAIRLALEHPAAAGQTYVLADGEDVSSAELVRRLAGAMNRPARLVPLPTAWLRLAGRMLGRTKQVDRLLGSLTVDAARIRRDLDWRPPFSLEQGLEATVKAFLAEGGHECR